MSLAAPGGLRFSTALTQSQRTLSISLQRLSQGATASPRAQDGPQVVTTAAPLSAHTSSLQRAIANAEAGLSFVERYAELAAEAQNLAEVLVGLVREATNTTLSDSARESLNTEFVDVFNTLNALAEDSPYADFNPNALNTTLSLGVGASTSITVKTEAINAWRLLGGGYTPDISTTTAAADALLTLEMKGYHETFVGLRSSYGSQANLLRTHLDVMTQQLAAEQVALNRITEVDMAQESAVVSREAIIQQSNVALMAQAASFSEMTLRLLE